MILLTKLFPPSELKRAFKALDEVEERLDYNPVYSFVIQYVKKNVYKCKKEIVQLFNEGESPEKWAYTAIANVSGDFLESGQFHLYRGVLNPIGQGIELLKLFDMCVDKLVEIGSINYCEAKEQKNGMRNCIKNNG